MSELNNNQQPENTEKMVNSSVSQKLPTMQGTVVDEAMKSTGQKNAKVDAKKDDPTVIKVPSVTKRNFSIILDYVKTFLLIIIEVIVVLLLVTFLIIPQYNRYLEISSSLESTKGELQIVSAQKDYLETLASLGEVLPENIDLAKEAIPVSDSEIPYCLNQLLYMASQSNISVDEQAYIGVSEEETSENLTSIEAINPSSLVPENADKKVEDALKNPEQLLAPEDQSVKKIVIKMAVSGKYEDLMSFLEHIEKSRRLYTVESISVEMIEKPANAESESLSGIAVQKYKLFLTLNGFYMPEIQASGLSVDALVSKPRLGSVVDYISNLDFYNHLLIRTSKASYNVTLQDIPLGKDNPFDTDVTTNGNSEVSESTPESSGF